MKTSFFTKFEKTVGGLKFAVTIILIFSAFMVAGTFIESSGGADFANRLIYKRWPFMGIQFLMFLSILFAAFLRLPPKKRLYGFYVIHSGLILLGIGSFITWNSGVDGSIALTQNDPNRRVELNEDIISIHDMNNGTVYNKILPYRAFPTKLNDEIKGIKVKEFLPFSENKLDWKKTKQKYASASYLLFNDNMSQDFTLSLHPQAKEFQSTLKMGKLNLHFLPSALGRCFAKPSKSKLIIWNIETKTCFTPEEKKVPLKKTKKGSRFLALPTKVTGSDTIISFFPDFSPIPLDEKLQANRNSPYRILSKQLFEEKPHLFLFGNKLSYYADGAWESEDMGDGAVSLPWMGFELKLIKHTTDEIPIFVPYFTTPIQKGGKLEKGGQKAVLVEYAGEEYWVTDKAPVTLLAGDKKMMLNVGKSSFLLPFEFTLTRFKMDTNPGTMDPASYESFVRLFTPDGPSPHHIYMNNPLKHSGFTFYQASYFQDNNGGYGTVLSVNIDPGRTLKYLGSLLVILGSIWHFVIRSEFFSRRRKLAGVHV
ncbi:MAG: hypothetical protein DRQ88_05545 [Epsilonproteobacteria bacterium]|nr:MAG: hypothetical protein DRQ89_09770 [Campylobacterota bacterium]RLA66780.1 MAG: hypothetical protein DRQ88_05545 [Campylobacterota bacterium]